MITAGEKIVPQFPAQGNVILLTTYVRVKSVSRGASTMEFLPDSL